MAGELDGCRGVVGEAYAAVDVDVEGRGVAGLAVLGCEYIFIDIFETLRLSRGVDGCLG